MKPPADARARRHVELLTTLVDLWRRAVLAHLDPDARCCLVLIVQSCELSTYSESRAYFEHYVGEQLGQAAALFWRDLEREGGLPSIAASAPRPAPWEGK